MATESKAAEAPTLRNEANAELLTVTSIPTAPIEGQKPGTSGLRKKTKVFMEGHYLHNFVQATFDSLPAAELAGSTIVVSGDGRFYTPEAIQIIIKIALANGVRRVWVGQHGLLSTPAVSAIIRQREGGAAYGGIILTASHNPGGPDDDFGIKYNTANGGPAPEGLTTAIFERTKTLEVIKSLEAFPAVDLATIGRTVVQRAAGADDAVGADGVCNTVEVEVIDNAADYCKMFESIFDLDAIRALIARPDFSFVYDAMHGVAGPYAQAIFRDMLGAPESVLRNCVPKPDFNGGHPDPNLTYAPELVATMGLNADGSINAAAVDVPAFGAAADGDADRNMVLGHKFFVTPSDSVALIAANAHTIPFFAAGLKGVARSMPTSAALDRVAAKKGIKLFEVPTGWKFFGNLMDSAAVYDKEDYTPFLCGEESFGTGSNHVREKDGVWAVLAWMSILADRNKDASAPLVSVEDIVRAHWTEYGRNVYSRYDYESVESDKAAAVMAHLQGQIDAFAAAKADSADHTQDVGAFKLASCDSFTYTDPVDGSVSANQGLRFNMTDGSRVVFRLSGTGSVGATIRMYLEKYEPDTSKHDMAVADALKELVATALGLSRIPELTGRDSPTVIT